MTLKQFFYLAGGAIISYLTFISLGAKFPFLAWPIIFTSALLGVAFAFLPIADRPLDHWVKAFLKATYSPTKRVWLLGNTKYGDEPLFRSRLSLFLSSLEAAPSTSITPMITPSVQHLPPRQSQPQLSRPGLPSPEELSETVTLARQAQNLQQQVVQTEKDLAQIKAATDTPGVKTEIYTERLNALLSNLQRLIQETTAIQTKMFQHSSAGPISQPKEVPKIQLVSPTPRPKMQLVLTSLPNVINGIAFDAQSNYLPEVVVVVRDKDGLPVRALKTNKLGQFTGATPLPNGTYTIELERDNFVFDILKIDLDGKVLPAINIAAKPVAGIS